MPQSSLSNTTINTLSTQYYDDYYAASNTEPGLTRGESFDFHRILFRPKYAVQSRELTQLQTILQAQLQRLGSSNFKNGQPVYGGEIALDTTVWSGKVLASTDLVNWFDRDLNVGQQIYDTTDSTIRAVVRQFASPDEDISLDGNYLVFKYETDAKFVEGTTITTVADTELTTSFLTTSSNTSGVFNPATTFSVGEGVFFVSGFFVRCKPQTIVLDAFTDKASAIVGLNVIEEVLDELDDVVGSTLLDPANQNAVGAHRLRLRLVLSMRALDSDVGANFITLATVVNGVVQKGNVIRERFVRWSELNDTLARRTYDESGDYVIRAFTPVITNDPYTEDHFRLALGPGKAYVHGWEAETTEPTYVTLRKGRTTASVNTASLALQVGNFAYVTRVAAKEPMHYFGNMETVDLHCVNIESIDTASEANYNRSRIGQATVRMIESHNIPANTAQQANNSVYKMFFFDTTFDTLTGNFAATGVLSNGAISAHALLANGIPQVNGALDGATVVLGGASSPVSGTFTVNNYVANTTAGIMTFKEYLPTLPNSNTTWRLMFQQKDIDAFALHDLSVTSIVSPYTANLAFQASVDLIEGKVGVAPELQTVVESTSRNSLVYQLPHKFVVANSMTTDVITWYTWMQTTADARAFVTANLNMTISVSGSSISFPTGALSATTAQHSLVIFDETADANGRGQIIQFADSPNSSNRCLSNVYVTQAGNQYDINFTYNYGGTGGGTRSLRGVSRVTEVGQTVRQKTLILGDTTSNVWTSGLGALDHGQIEYHSINTATGSAYSLKTADVFRIQKVLYKDSNTAFETADLTVGATGITDVTNYFTLDTGQRDNTYENAALVTGRGANRLITPNGRLLIIFDWFAHTGRGYCTLDSYLTPLNVINGMTYELVPDYTSSKTGRTVSLRDVLDFRPVQSNIDGRDATNFVFSAVTGLSELALTCENTDYLSSDTTPYLIPTSDDAWLGGYDYYLGHIDNVGLGFDGVFRVIEGQDADFPVAPLDDTGGLLMFQLNIPPYTLVDVNGVPVSTTLTTFEHKRYTMQDLTKVENRVAHLEYYTALNSLETITKNQTELDGEDNERFKNGIIVDSFHGGDVGDVSNTDFTASIDVQNRELRTAFRTNVMQFSADIYGSYTGSTSNGITLIGDMAVPTYNVTPFITQKYATHALSVNPFNIATFYGNVRLSPAVDIWKETSGMPAQVIDLGGPTEAWVSANLPSYTNWGEWDQTWSGVVASTPNRQYSTPPGWTPQDHGFRSMSELSWDDVESQTNYERQGTTYEYQVSTTTASLGNRVVDTSVIHNCRQRDIVFSADGLKPKASLYAFFDGTNVDGYVQRANVLELTEIPTSSMVPLFVGQTVYVQKAVTGNATITAGSTDISGSGSKFSFELVAGQLVRFQQGGITGNKHDAFISAITSNTTATIAQTPTLTFTSAKMYTLTPVTITEVSPRYVGANVAMTIKVARAVRDTDVDQGVPYAITAGSLRPEAQVKDVSNTATVGATLIVPASPQCSALTINVESALCVSGVVRSYDTGTGSIRFDTDVTDAEIVPGVTTVRIVGGPGAGQSATVTRYDAADKLVQTAVLDSSSLSGIVAGQSIYSIGQLASDGYVSNTSVTVGRAGCASGVFHLQSEAFAVGTRLFRLTDTSDNAPAHATTAGETNYTASGLSVTTQDTSVTSRSALPIRAGARQESMTITDHNVQNIALTYVDPLAETFLVDAKEFPQGIFLSSVDLCFASIPDDDVPVTVEIRPVVNGYPSSQNIVPCCSAAGAAIATLRRDQVVTATIPSFTSSTSVGTETRFTFPALVHLMAGKEYAIVVRSDSDNYEVFTAELGGQVLGTTDTKVSAQPYAGSFFKSQNASAWTESPFEDLMFRLNRAVWTGSAATPQTSVLIARGVPVTANVLVDSIEFYPHDVQFSDVTGMSYVLGILPVNETTGDQTDSIAQYYSVLPNEWRPLSVRSLLMGRGDPSQASTSVSARVVPSWTSQVLGSANTVDAIVTMSTWHTDVAPYVDMKKMNMLYITHNINDMGLVAEDIMITNPGDGYFVTKRGDTVTSTTGSANVDLAYSNATIDFRNYLQVGDRVAIGGSLVVNVASVTNSSQFVATANVAARVANTWYTYGWTTDAANSKLDLTITGGGGSGAEGYAQVGRDGRIASIVLTNNGAGYVTAPTITVVGANAVGGFSLTTANGTLETLSEVGNHGGNGLTRYFTRPTTLASGFDARDIKVYFDAYRPAGTAFYVYYKVLASDRENERFADQPWRIMTQVTPDSTISTRWAQFKEFQFKTPNNRALDAATDTTDKFRVVALKVIMATDNAVNAPRITNFRAIVLDV